MRNSFTFIQSTDNKRDSNIYSNDSSKSSNFKTHTKTTIKIKSRSIIKVIVSAFIGLFILHMIAVIGFENGVVFHRFYFDTEANLPSYLNTMILLIASLLLGYISFFKWQEKDNFKIQWIALSAIFFCLSVDENSGLHEVFIDPLSERFNLTGIFRLCWVVLGIPFVLFFIFYYFKFFMGLSNSMKLKFFISGALFVTGALGVEMVGGYIWSHENYGNESLAYRIAITVEESLEMIAIIYFISTLLSYIKDYRPKVNLDLHIK